MKSPNVLVMNDLYSEFHETHTRSDLLACWNNAHRYWGLMPQFVGENEPAEVTAARALFVRAHATKDDPEYQQRLYSGVWVLVSPYSKLTFANNQNALAR